MKSFAESQVKVITKFLVNRESETAQAVSALPSPFIQCRLAPLNLFVESMSRKVESLLYEGKSPSSQSPVGRGIVEEFLQ